MQPAQVSDNKGQGPDSSFTERQQEVLSAALSLLAENGDRLTMTEVARRASCSKETLYKWFGDRQGLLTATVRWQAAKVRAPQFDPAAITEESLRQSVEQFARDLLGTLVGEVSVTLNRLAVAHAAEAAGLGTIVLENGPLAMRQRFKPLLEAGRKSGLLAFDDADAAFRSFFGLVVGDTQIRLLLGDATLRRTDVVAAARGATSNFFALYGA